MGDKEWAILKPATVIWTNNWIKILEIRVRLPTGVEAEFYTLDAPDSIAVLAVDEQQRAVLNRQFRPALDKVILELPSGSIENGEDAVKTVRKELAEESGVLARDIEYLGSFYRNPGRDTGLMHVYFARVAGDTSPHQERYEYLETIRIPLEDLKAKVLNNEIQDVTTIFAVLMLQNQLEHGSIRL